MSDVDVLDLTACGTLTFHRPDDETFPGMGICRKAIIRGGLYPAAVNAANEQAVALFLAGKLVFWILPACAGRRWSGLCRPTTAYRGFWKPTAKAGGEQLLRPGNSEHGYFLGGAVPARGAVSGPHMRKDA